MNERNICKLLLLSCCKFKKQYNLLVNDSWHNKIQRLNNKLKRRQHVVSKNRCKINFETDDSSL